MPKKEKTGLVISNKMEKTVVVAVNDYEPHPKYKKIMTETKNYVASDVKNECNEGDTVRIVESKPVSKTKRWTVAEVIERAK
ncbi:MAG TPA: 30S ribosomal protein S17 [Candidatus Adamsella sp.]|nr:30S ribosomal protein S17 [Candidatus Adamsella sp.]